MTEKKTADYGCWRSPITAELVASANIGLGTVGWDGADIYWLESRPLEKGRSVVVRYDAATGQGKDYLPSEFNARSRVHEYGGGAFLVQDGTLLFVNFADQRIYRKIGAAEPQPITPAEALLHADLIYDRQRQVVYAVREDHRQGALAATNMLIKLDLATLTSEIIVSGQDFYASPALSPDGQQLAWLSWSHPNMPWDGTELWVADLTATGEVVNARQVAGGAQESIFQPRWSPQGTLYFVSDRSNWWNIYQLTADGGVKCVYAMAAEFGLPQWVFGLSTYDFVSNSEIVCSYVQEGQWYLGLLNIDNEQLITWDLPYTELRQVSVNRTTREVVFLAGAPQQPLSVVRLNLETRATTVLQTASTLSFSRDYISVPQSIAFPTTNDLTAYAFYYPPTNPDYQAPLDSRPPLLVKSHGGPTSATDTLFDPTIQYWTSRGFAVVDVNYGGSTGYGRDYRERLRHQWGIVDLDDCVNAALYLVNQGLADGERLAIDGGSAGGYTTLCALTFRQVFKAGASYYGVSDLIALDDETHKFESQYGESLIISRQHPDYQRVSYERSPINFIDQLSCPVIFFQGLEDKIVLPNQAEMMVEALRKKGIPVAYLPFEGEQHGFRQAANIKRALEAEAYFYSRVFGFTLADSVAPVVIDNLPES
jgi:dipeptidyl aminopeptidase/acylaminoacyl peptidase